MLHILLVIVAIALVSNAFVCLSQVNVIPRDSLSSCRFFARIGLDSALNIYKHTDAICNGYRWVVLYYIVDQIDFQMMSYDSLIKVLGHPSYYTTYIDKSRKDTTCCLLVLNYYQSGICENGKLLLVGDYRESWQKIYIDPETQQVAALRINGFNEECENDIQCQLERYYKKKVPKPPRQGR